MEKLLSAEIAQLDTIVLMAQILLSLALPVAIKVDDRMLALYVRLVISVRHLEQLLFYALWDLTRMKLGKLFVTVAHMAAIAQTLIFRVPLNVLQDTMLPQAI